jgi:flavin reductase (DIM6/NTAB) family NADH-FMN oxidoreductase RutF
VAAGEARAGAAGAGDAGAEERFHELVGDLDYPMFIVTAKAAGARSGCLVGFLTQTSIDPPRVLVCISRRNHTFSVARRASALAVHLVPSRAGALAALFGGVSGHDEDKFLRSRWHEGPEGCLILEECENWFVGRILERLDLGDHEGILLAPTAVRYGERVPAFQFHRAKRIQAGREA